MRSAELHIGAAVFDLDGTLVDSAPDIIDSLNRAFDAAGVSPSSPVTRADIGPPVREMITATVSGLEPDAIERVVAAFREIYDNHTFSGTVLKAGVAELLDDLNCSGAMLFVATNKPLRPTEGIIRKLGLSYFKDVVTPDCIAGRSLSKTEMLELLIERWGFATKRALMFGDADSDIIAARNCRMISVAVLDGYGTRDSIVASSPDYIIDQIGGFLSLNFSQVAEAL